MAEVEGTISIAMFSAATVSEQRFAMPHSNNCPLMKNAR
jgi:hypothetical protein